MSQVMGDLQYLSHAGFALCEAGNQFTMLLAVYGTPTKIPTHPLPVENLYVLGGRDRRRGRERGRERIVTAPHIQILHGLGPY